MLKIMKRIVIIFSIFSFLFVPMACNKELDINKNPLAATKADPNAVLPYVMVVYSNRKITEVGTRMIDVWQNVAATFNSGRDGTTPIFVAINEWRILYTDVLANLTLVEKDARAVGATNNNITAIAVILKALAYHDLTCLFNDVPFTEALNAKEFPAPKFDSQQTVLNGIITLLDDAVVLIDAIPAVGAANVSTGDLIYGGNMDSWRRYARSLQLRVLMLIRNNAASAPAADTKINAILTEDRLINSNTTNAAMLKYSNAPGNQNAWAGLQIRFGTGSNETNQFWGPSAILRGLLFDIGGPGVHDPRLNLWAIPGTGGTYFAQPIGTFPTAATGLFRDNLVRTDLPDMWFLPSEISFYKAELALKGVIPGGAVAADFSYRQGLNETLSFWGGSIPGARITLTSSQIATFIATKADLNSLTLANALIEVGNQQYLEAFWRPIESWNTVRRNKVPDVLAAPGSTVSTMVKRLNYPSTEVGSNPNTPGPKNTDVKMWFEN